jgi:hypothetical protein
LSGDAACGPTLVFVPGEHFSFSARISHILLPPAPRQVCDSRCSPLLRLALRFEQLWQRYQAGLINTGTAGLFQSRLNFVKAGARYLFPIINFILFPSC